jgi:copper homeostasis protein
MIEAYVETAEQALETERAGANRLELCGPGEGGLTPSKDLLLETLKQASIPTHVMIRPRSGDFNYSQEEFERMLDSVKLVKDIGAAGVVFGILNADKTLDKERMKTLIEASRPMKVVCHKAFDETPNEREAI